MDGWMDGLLVITDGDSFGFWVNVFVVCAVVVALGSGWVVGLDIITWGGFFYFPFLGFVDYSVSYAVEMCWSFGSESLSPQPWTLYPGFVDVLFSDKLQST